MPPRTADGEERTLSPASPLKFNFRRIVGGSRLLLTQASPWKLLFQGRIGELKADLVAEVASWEEVEAVPHRFGGTEFLLEHREVGHIHEWGLFDVPFARPIGDAIVEAGEAGRHHILPDSGWVTTFVEDQVDRDHAREILRLSYLWHVAKYAPDGVERDLTAIEAEVRGLALADSIADAFETTLAERLR